MTENLWNVETECQHSSLSTQAKVTTKITATVVERVDGVDHQLEQAVSEVRPAVEDGDPSGGPEEIILILCIFQHHQYLWPPSAAMVPAIAPPAAPAWSDRRVRDSLEKTWHQTRIVKEIQTRDWSSKASRYDCHCSTHAKLELSFKQFDLRELVR